LRLRHHEAKVYLTGCGKAEKASLICQHTFREMSEMQAKQRSNLLKFMEYPLHLGGVFYRGHRPRTQKSGRHRGKNHRTNLNSVLEIVPGGSRPDHQWSSSNLPKNHPDAMIYTYIYTYIYIIGGFNHLEKYEFVNGKDYPIYEMEN